MPANVGVSEKSVSDAKIKVFFMNKQLAKYLRADAEKNPNQNIETRNIQQYVF